jgi:hypothetical protein
VENIVLKVVVFSIFLFSGVCLPAYGQSRDQNFPTPVRSNVIEGIIPARALGDARLTAYFYTFEGDQGDIFINVVTTNLTGDIDVYTADSLRPLTKIVLYADSGVNETGRLIYLRRPARLILRVQGRTPNDDPATFRIKFGGSYAASRLPDVEDAPVVESIGERAGIRVNSVGTIIPREAEPAVEEKVDKAEQITAENSEKEKSAEVTGGEIEKSSEERAKVARAPEVRTVFGNPSTRTRTPEKEAASGKTSSTAARDRRTTPAAETTVSRSKPADPLASIMLIIETKDGGIIEHPMSEVVRFSVDKGVLTLVVKSGKTNRYSILNVEKVTIQ